MNKTILITGASDGIGRNISLKLASENVNLILLGRDKIKLDEVKRLCESEGSKVTTYSFDITDDSSRESVIREIRQSCQVDVLINNAGIWHKSTPLEELSSEEIQAVISTNLTAQILLTSSLVGDMKERETAIINIISSAGLQGRAGRTAYAASKYGMRGFIEALRDETKVDVIRIGAIFQSGTNTQMFAKAGEDMPIDKYSEPGDLADIVVFMLTRPPKIWINELHVVY